MTTRVLVPSGVLGLGFSRTALEAGLARDPHIIAIDGGSTDSGPFYLGTGTSKYARAAIKSEWRDLMAARAKAGIPLLIGSAGTCGTDSTVAEMLEITREIAAETGQSVRVATLHSSQSASDLVGALEAGRIHPLNPAPELNPERLSACTNIVALAGAEQIAAALETGADIVIAGRTTDTAVIAALPLMRGEAAGSAWHGAKVAECGALCTTDPKSGVILATFDGDGFTIEPMGTNARCTPRSVSAHMLYENSDPFLLHEPGGTLDVRAARYHALDERTVRVSGSVWHATKPYTVKLEGATSAGFQTTIMAVIRDARYVTHAEVWAEQLQAFLVGEIRTRMGLEPDRYTLEFRLIGINAALGALESRKGAPAEVGVLGIITAESQDIAAEIGKLANPFVLHHALTDNEEMPSFAFPYSPAQSDRGALYEFCLNHVLALEDPMQAFRLNVHEVG